MVDTSSMARGVDHVAPSRLVDMTIRASPSTVPGRRDAYPRAAHARYTRPVSSIVIVGYAFVRNENRDVPWPKDARGDTRVGVLKRLPPSVDRVTRIESGMAGLAVESANCRQAM